MKSIISSHTPLRALIALHLAVFLFGSAGVFGKLLMIPAILLVFGRTFFATLALGVFLRTRAFTNKNISYWKMAICGILLAVHWLLFFESIIVSSIAVGLMGFASFPIFVAWLEPFWFKKQRNKLDWVASLAVIFGLWLLLPPGWVLGNVTLGLFLGILSGLSFALLVLVNRTIMQTTTPPELAFWQNAFAAIVLMPFAPWQLIISLPPMTWVGLIIMGVIFTALSHTLFMYSLSKLSALLAAITSTLEPVYGIILAAILLGETVSQNELLGIITILSTTLFMTILQTKSESSNKTK